jgi:hypothetical protein
VKSLKRKNPAFGVAIDFAIPGLLERHHDMPFEEQFRWQNRIMPEVGPLQRRRADRDIIVLDV